MAAMLETPSRIWRRIEAVEGRDMPSLPSLPPFEDSQESEVITSSVLSHSSDDLVLEGLHKLNSPMHSTPASSHHTAATIRAGSSTSSTARFATSLESRSVKSSLALSSLHGSASRKSQLEPFNISKIASITDIKPDHSSDTEESGSDPSVPDMYLPPPDDDNELDDDFSLPDALQPISRSASPLAMDAYGSGGTPKKSFDYSTSLRSELKPSPLDKYRNVALRRSAAITRTPSLTRTSSSQTSSPTNSTPKSNRSVTLPRSNAGSPISSISIILPRSNSGSPGNNQVGDGNSHNVEPGNMTNETDMRSMDITDVHISPPRLDEEERYTEDEAPQSDDVLSQRSKEEENQESPDEREPTFSSEEVPTDTSNTFKQDAQNSPGAFSSPGTSMAFTPTPAFPRPRARFNLPPPPSDIHLATPQQHQGAIQQEHDDYMTPHTRRRSFLLSVIHSTARPRMKVPTPHPRNQFTTPSTVQSTPASSSESASSGGANLHTAFAGVTPRPRMPIGRRTSHHLTQQTVPSPAASESESPNSASTSAKASVNGEWATPAPPSNLSPYDGVVDRASFISTASSHDLTTHHRANTSFDPAMGFGAGAPGHGVGRFNAGKLNNYLHGLNRRLQEENEALLEKLRKMEDKHYSGDVVQVAVMPGESRRRSSGRLSTGGSALGNVQEDVAETWLEEKAELEGLVQTCQEEMEKCLEEKDELEQALEKEKEERERDKERWRERMAEVERGVGGIITGLEQKLEAAEERVQSMQDEASEQMKDKEKQLVELRGDRDVAMERAEKAERVLESGKELGGELKEANSRITQVMGDLRNANAQIRELEEVVMNSDARIDELEDQLRNGDSMVAALEKELNDTADALAEKSANMQEMEDRLRQIEEELQSTKSYADELEEGAQAAVAQIDRLENELSTTQENLDRVSAEAEDLRRDCKSLEEDSEKAREMARQMEDALEDAEKKMLADEEAVNELNFKVTCLERDLERQRQANNALRDEHDVQAALQTVPTEADLEALEEELNHANKEIGRLTSLLNQSPARKAMDKAKDTRIEMLEKEREELLERNKALRMTVTDVNTPSRVMNISGISPIHRHVLSMSVRAPKTPGGPLRDMSWLNNTTSEPTAGPLIAEIQRLQHELDLANESIDDKIDKLEDAGFGVVGLTAKFEDARARIVVLEEEIDRLERKEERRMKRLERARCRKCSIKLDLAQMVRADESSLEISRDSLPTEPPTPPTRTTEGLHANLKSVNIQLDVLKKQWDQERKQLIGEKTALQDATKRLNVQVKTAKEEARKVVDSERIVEQSKATVQNELDRAKKTIAELEADLASERSRLRNLTTEQQRMQREKQQILTQLQRTESDMDDVKQHLQKFKQEKNEIERELRENVNAEQKARLLEKRVAENAENMEQLRQERSLLVADHKELQRRFSEISETANRLRNEYAAHSTSHENRRHQLDLQLLEIDDLRHALSDKADELERVEVEKNRISAEKSDVARTVAILEADLRRVKKDAESFGRDLKTLRAEKEKLESTHKTDLSKAERTKKQNQAQIRILNEQLESLKEEASRAKNDLQNHTCEMDKNKLAAIKYQHNQECKGLIVQIRYLKSKICRESLFRSDLGYQKKYLLVLLSQFEKSERTIIASIAHVGFPIMPSTYAKKKPSKLKTVALMVVFLGRVRRTSDQWRVQRSSKQAIAAALEDVRRRRASTAA